MQPRYGDQGRASVILEVNGQPVWVSVDRRNSAYMELLDSGVVIGEYIPPPAPPPSADDVRTEASRRMMAMVGARSPEHLAIVIANGSREAIRLLRVRAERAWTAEEATRAADLEAIDTAIEAIRAASNAMEPSPPADYASNERWP